MDDTENQEVQEVIENENSTVGEREEDVQHHDSLEFDIKDVNMGTPETEETTEQSSSQEESQESSEEQSEESTQETSESTESSETENTDDPSDGGTSEESSEQTESEQQEETSEEYSEEESYLALSDETGVEVTSDEDVVDRLKELASLRSNGSESDLSPSILEAIKVEKAGGNLSEHFTRTGMDFEKMDSKEVLRQDFFRNNAELHSASPDLAQIKFDREFSKNYGKWAQHESMTDPDDKKEFFEDNQADIEYEKLMFEHDSTKAKGDLNTWKETAAPVAQEAAGVMTKEESKDYADKFELQAGKSLSNFKAVDIPMGEGLKDFALGLNEKTKPIVEGWVNNPSVFLKDIGFDGTEINTDRLMPIMTLIAEASNGNLGGRIAKYALDSGDVETLKKQLEKPSSTAKQTTQDHHSEQSGDEWDLIGEAAEKANVEASRR